MMKVAHARIDEQTGFHFTILVGVGVVSLLPGLILRCAGYRFSVHDVPARYPEAPNPTVGALLIGLDAPTEGMILHLVSEPLTREELSAALRHLLMVPRMLKAVDTVGAINALVGTSFDTPEAQRVAHLLRNLAHELGRVELPTDAQMLEASRYVEDVLARC